MLVVTAILLGAVPEGLPVHTVQVPGDQDIADLLSALGPSSTAAPGGLYAAALPPHDTDSSRDCEGAGGALPSVLGAAAEDHHQQQQEEEAGQGPAGKVQAVCSTVRTALEQRNSVSCCWQPGVASSCTCPC